MRLVGARLLSCAVVVATLGGCATMAMRNPVPTAALSNTAEISGLASVRFFADEMPTDLLGEVRRRAPNMPRLAQNAERIGGRPVVEILALSGGGADGAFGAGLLTGWSEQGTRPEFEIVTGVSAGAIIAPFAFLGASHDRQLKDIWTDYRTDELILSQILPGLLGGSSLADTAPLAALIEKYVNKRMLADIAREYRRGRMLLILTTNLDAQRPVVWNMGEIAASGHKDAPELFRKVILASAAIPGAFPPVGVTVQAGGKTYDEMHVDGGTTMEVFVSPVRAPLKAFDKLYARPPIRHIYIVKNGRLMPEYKPVQPQTIPIVSSAISTLLLNQSNDEIYRIYREARDGGASFRLAAIPSAFNAPRKEVFDPVYQGALFDVGYKLGRSGNPWMSTPPDVRPRYMAGR